MKRISRTVAAMILTLGFAGVAQADAGLPKMRIMGKTFYSYVSKKGDTLDDIARTYGWDPALLAKVNPDVGKTPDEGSLIYYPVLTDSAKESISEVGTTPAGSADASSAEKIIDRETVAPTASEKGRTFTHTVKSGETIYGIARQYDTTIENLYALNPALERDGIKKGSVIIISTSDVAAADKDSNGNQSATVNTVVEVIDGTDMSFGTGQDKYVYHKIEEDESLYGISREYGTSIEDIFRENPGLGTGALNPGTVIRIKKKGEEALVKNEAQEEDPREKNAEGLQELYNEVHTLSESEKERYEINEVPTVGVAVILTDIGKTADDKRSKQNKEMEFSRGAITAVDAMKNNPFKTRLTIIDGSLPEQDITSTLDEFKPSILISTSDTSIPTYLTDYVADKQIMIVNAFAAKDDTYIDNSKVVQYLVPTSYMNAALTDYIDSTFRDYKLLVAGSPDPSDALATAVIEMFSKRGKDAVEEIETDGIGQLALDSDGKYLIYGTPVAQKDVKALLEGIGDLRTRNMMADVRVLGRPNWVPYTLSLSTLMDNNYVYLPSRYYFDPKDAATSEFINHYENLFKLRPMKASPVYCATAYDILTYFVPNLAQSGGDFNATFTPYPTIQSPMGLSRVSNWSGIVNKGVYVLSFTPTAGVERIVLGN